LSVFDDPSSERSIVFIAGRCVLRENIGQESQIRKKKGKALSSSPFLREEHNRQPIRNGDLGNVKISAKTSIGTGD